MRGKTIEAWIRSVFRLFAFLFVMGLILNILLPAQGIDEKEIEKLARECEAGIVKSCLKLEKIARKSGSKNEREWALLIDAVGRIKSDAPLAEIARNNKNSDTLRLAAIRNPSNNDQALFAQIIMCKAGDLREAAFEKLTDQALLATIFKMDSMSDGKRMGFDWAISGKWNEKLMAQINNQPLIADIAKNAKNDDVRETAVRKLTNQALLADIGKNDEDWDVRQAAVEKLDDQNVLADIAKTDYWHYVRKAAVLRIEDTEVLADIAKNDKDSGVSTLAAERQRLFLESRKPDALSHEDWKVRRYAVKTLIDHALLARVAINDEDDDVRKAAVEKLADQAVLAYVAKNDKTSFVRDSAVKKLTDQALLADIARNDENWRVRETALKKLSNQPAFIDIAKNDKYFGVRKAAVEKITDQVVLSEIAKTDEISDVRHAAVGKLTDQALLARVAVEDESWNVRKTAVEKITDQLLLSDIVKHDKDSFVRLAAVTNPNLTDQKVFAETSKYEEYSEVREAAVSRLTTRARREIAPWINAAVTERLTERRLLAEIAMTSGNPFIVITAASNEHLTNDEALLKEVRTVRVKLLDKENTKRETEVLETLAHALKDSGIEVFPNTADADGIFTVIINSDRYIDAYIMKDLATGQTRPGGGFSVTRGAVLLTSGGRLAYASTFYETQTHGDPLPGAIEKVVSKLKAIRATR